MNKSIVFMDRDGTLIEERHYLRDPQQVVLLPGALGGLRRLQKAGFPLVVISNQSGVGRGWMTRAQAEAVNQRFQRLLKKGGVRLGGLFWCPHAPADHCACRKPKLGLIQRAARMLRRPWRGNFCVGDKTGDIAMGRRSGGRGILVLTGYGRETRRRLGRVQPDFVAKDFQAAAEWILRQSRHSRSRKRESRDFKRHWVPAFAGTTANS